MRLALLLLVCGLFSACYGGKEAASTDSPYSEVRVYGDEYTPQCPYSIIETIRVQRQSGSARRPDNNLWDQARIRNADAVINVVEFREGLRDVVSRQGTLIKFTDPDCKY